MSEGRYIIRSSVCANSAQAVGVQQLDCPLPCSWSLHLMDLVPVLQLVFMVDGALPHKNLCTRLKDKFSTYLYALRVQVQPLNTTCDASVHDC